MKYVVIRQNWFGQVEKYQYCETLEDAKQVLNCYEMTAKAYDECYIEEVDED